MDDEPRGPRTPAALGEAESRAPESRAPTKRTQAPEASYCVTFHVSIYIRLRTGQTATELGTVVLGVRVIDSGHRSDSGVLEFLFIWVGRRLRGSTHM